MASPGKLSICVITSLTDMHFPFSVRASTAASFETRAAFFSLLWDDRYEKNRDNLSLLGRFSLN